MKEIMIIIVQYGAGMAKIVKTKTVAVGLSAA